MGKMLINESQLKCLIKKVINTLKESTRDDLYKNQIEKEFPGALDNYDGKMLYDQYYLKLTNDKKEQDKLHRRTDRKNGTIQRNSEYNARYGELDKQLKKENEENKKIELIDDFVDFLPEKFPDYVDLHMQKYNEGKDGAFYFLIGKYIGEFGVFYDQESPVRMSDYLTKLINNDKYEDYFLDKVYGKFGDLIEW